MEWYPCSYSGGIADKSLGIVNCFSQRPESLNIDFREPGFADKITYMTATDASIEGAPPTNAVIINLGYGNTHWGVQLGFNPSSVVSARRAYMRSSLGDGTYSEWVDFITGNNLDNQLDTHGVTYLAQTFGNNRGLPFAGTTGDIPAEGFSEWFKTVRSGFYTMVNGTGGWMQAVVLKHRNGHGDGTGYGIYIYDSLTSKTRTLKWNKMVNNEMFGNDLTILDTGNYSSQIGRINNRLLLDHGSYVNTQSGTNGTAGLVNFMRIKITSTYADYPLIFLLSGRGRNMPMLVSVHYQSYNGLYPDISSFYRMFNDTYDIYIHNTGGGVWNLYAPKNEAYGAVDILGLWYSSGHFEITFPNTHVASVNSAWTKAITAGITNAANFLKDSGNAVPVYLSYNKSSISVSNTTWLAGWVNNGSNYELRAFNRADLIQAKMANGYYGMCFGNYQDNGWVRTTQQGLLPYQSGNISSPHSQLGTETWWFLKSYIADMYANNLTLSKIYSNNETSISGAYHKAYLLSSSYYFILGDNARNISNGNITMSPNIIINPTQASGYSGIWPYNNGVGLIGTSNNKWNQVWATNSSIQTSDRREKKEISYIGKNSEYDDTSMDDESLKSFIHGLLPVIYKRRNGESGRPHHGFIAQDVEKLMQELGIKDHAAFIKSPKTETVEIEEEAEKTYTDETDGQTRTRTVIQKKEEQRELPGEYVYGLRYEEFIADIVRFIQIQDERIEEQERKINSLEGRLSALENMMLNTSTD